MKMSNQVMQRRARLNRKRPLLFFLYFSWSFLVLMDALSWFSAIPTANASSTNQNSRQGASTQDADANLNSQLAVKARHQNFPEYQQAFTYQPSGGLGIRFSQHFFPDENDKIFVDGLSHTEQSLQRRKQRLEVFSASLEDLDYVQDFEPEHSIDKMFTGQKPDPTRTNKQMKISHQFYQQKIEVFETDKQGVAFLKASAPTMKGEVPPEQAAQQKAERRMSEIDLKRRQVLKSQSITMGTIQKTDQPMDRAALDDSAVMAHAFGYRESTEMPVYRIEENEAKQIVEDMFSKMAKRQHIENYQTFVRFLGETTVNDPAVINKRFFYRDPSGNHPIRTTGLLIQDIVPRDLVSLKETNYMAKFFDSTVTVEPHLVHMENVNLLIPQTQEIKVENKSLKDPTTVDFVLSSTPEIVFFHVKDGYNHQAPSGFPLELQPKASLKIQIMFAPETVGEINAIVYIGLNRKFVYMVPFKAFVHPNKFGLQPLYFNNVNTGETVEYKLSIKNDPTLNTQEKIAGTDAGAAGADLNIHEAYSTEPYLTLLWPNRTPVENSMSVTQPPQKDFSKYTKVPPGTKKHILTLQFETDVSVDHRAVVHLFTDTGILIRLPCYFHVNEDKIRFSPPIVDFGITSWRFNVLRMPVNIQMRQTGIQTLFLSDVILPLNDERLDFVMGKWTDDTWKRTSQTEAFFKSNKTPQTESKYARFKDQFKNRKSPVVAIEPDSEGIMALTVLLDPYKAGRIDQEIEFVFLYEQNEGEPLEEFRVSLPIIGYVGIQRNMITSNTAIDENFRPEMVYEPAIDLRVSGYSVFHVPFVPKLSPIKSVFTNEIQPGLLMSPKDQPRVVMERNLYLVNMFKIGNLTLDIEGAEIWNDNSEILYRARADPQPINLKIHGQNYFSWPIGQFLVHPDDLKITSGTKYFTMLVNDTMFTQAIDIRDWSLLCHIEEDYAIEKYEDCRSMSSPLDFGRIGFYQPKTRRIQITNLSSLPITFVSLEKDQDEVIVDLLYPETGVYADPQAYSRTTATNIGPNAVGKEYYDSSGAVSKNKKSLISAEDASGVKTINQTLYPKSTITLLLTAEGTYSTVPGTSQSVSKHSFMTLRYTGLNLGTRSFSINYGYKVLPGSFGFVNNMAQIPPCLPGQIQTIELNAINRFQTDLRIRSVSTTDQRLKPRLLHTVVPALADATSLVHLTFEPANPFKKGHQIVIREKNDQTDGILQPTAAHTHQVNIHSKEAYLPALVDNSKGKSSTYLKKNKPENEQDPNGNFTVNLMFNHTDYLNTDPFVFMEKNGGRLMTKHELARWRTTKLRDVSKPTHRPAPVWVNGEWRDDISETINAQIKIDTDVVQSISINITAFVQEPKIIQNKKLDFGILHIGSSSTLDFDITNPFNETMSAQLFLGRKDQTWDNFYADYVEKEKDFDHRQLETAVSQGIYKVLNNQMRQDLFQKMPFMTTYCKNIDIFWPLKDEEDVSFDPEELNTIIETITFDGDLNLREVCPKLLLDYIYYAFEINFRMNKSLPTSHPLATTERQPQWKLKKSQHSNIWTNVESFFKDKLLEALEAQKGDMLSISAVTNPLEVIEAIKLGAIDLIKFPEALQITSLSDAQAVDDIIKMTFARSQLWNPDNFNEAKLAHKRVFEDRNRQHSWLYTKFTKKVITPINQFYTEYVRNPSQKVSKWWQTQQQETYLKRSINLLKIGFTGLYETFRRTFVSKQKPVVVRINEDFQFDPQLFADEDANKPSMFLSQFFSMSDKSLHTEVLQNNGTAAFQTSLQNYFIAPPFQGIPIEVQAQDHVKILESIVFEPKALSGLPQEQLQMTVFLVTNRSEVLSVDVTGSTGSALLDVAKVNMLKFTESGRKENFPLKQYTRVFDKGCSFLYDPISVLKDVDAVPVVEPISPEDRSNCIDDAEIGRRLQKELFNESHITRTLNFVIDEEDLAPGGGQELTHMEKQFDFWTSLDLVYMKWAYTEQELNEYRGEKRRNTYEQDLERIQGYGTVREDKLVKENKEYAKYYILQTGLENEFAWFLKIFNKGNLPFEADEVGFEVPGSDRLACQTQEFALIYCQAGTFLPQRVTRKTVGIKFRADFSVPRYQKVLTFRNKRITQRFIINLEITPTAMQVAQRFQNLNYEGDEFKIAEAYLLSLLGRNLMIIGLWIVIKRNYTVITDLYNQAVKERVPVEKVLQDWRYGEQKIAEELGGQRVINQVTPSAILSTYSAASEKFTINQTLFLKESINLTQRKNSFTLDFLRKQLQSTQKPQRALQSAQQDNQTYIGPELNEHPSSTRTSPRQQPLMTEPQPQIEPVVRKPVFIPQPIRREIELSGSTTIAAGTSVNEEKVQAKRARKLAEQEKAEKKAEERKIKSAKTTSTSQPVSARNTTSDQQITPLQPCTEIPSRKTKEQKQPVQTSSKKEDQSIKKAVQAQTQQLIIPDDIGEIVQHESGVSTPASSMAQEANQVKVQKVVKMSKKDRKAAEKRLKEYQETINNQLLSEKKQKEQAALDEVKRAQAEAEAFVKAKEAAAARAKLAVLKERFSGSGSKHLDSLHEEAQKKRENLKVQKFDSAQKSPKKKAETKTPIQPCEPENQKDEKSERSSRESSISREKEIIIVRKKTPLQPISNPLKKLGQAGQPKQEAEKPQVPSTPVSESSSRSVSPKNLIAETAKAVIIKPFQESLKEPQIENKKDRQSSNSSHSTPNRRLSPAPQPKSTYQKKNPNYTPESDNDKAPRYVAKQNKPQHERRTSSYGQEKAEKSENQKSRQKYEKWQYDDEVQPEEEQSQGNDSYGYYDEEARAEQEYDPEEFEDEYNDYGYEDEATYRRPPSTDHYQGEKKYDNAQYQKRRWQEDAEPRRRPWAEGERAHQRWEEEEPPYSYKAQHMRRGTSSGNLGSAQNYYQSYRSGSRQMNYGQGYAPRQSREEMSHGAEKGYYNPNLTGPPRKMAHERYMQQQMDYPYSSTNRQTSRSTKWKAKRLQEHEDQSYPTHGSKQQEMRMQPPQAKTSENNLRTLAPGARINAPQRPLRYIDYAQKPSQQSQIGSGLTQSHQDRDTSSRSPNTGFAARTFPYQQSKRGGNVQASYPPQKPNLHTLNEDQQASEEDYQRLTQTQGPPVAGKRPYQGASNQYSPQQPQYKWQQKPQNKQTQPQPEEDPIQLYNRDQLEEESPNEKQSQGLFGRQMKPEKDSESEENESGMQFTSAFKSIQSIFSSNKQQNTGSTFGQGLGGTTLFGGLPVAEDKRSSWLNEAGKSNYFDAFADQPKEEAKKQETSNFNDLFRNSRPLGGQNQTDQSQEAPQELFKSLEKTQTEDQQQNQGIGFQKLNFQWKELSPFNANLVNTLPGQPKTPISLPKMAGSRASPKGKSPFATPLFTNLMGRGSSDGPSSGRSRRSSRVEEDDTTSQKGNYSLFS